VDRAYTEEGFLSQKETSCELKAQRTRQKEKEKDDDEEED